MPTPTCDTCVFWQHRHELDVMTDGRLPGSCRRRSPFVLANPNNGKPVTRWPLTANDEFCGDHALVCEDGEVATAPSALASSAAEPGP